MADDITLDDVKHFVLDNWKRNAAVELPPAIQASVSRFVSQNEREIKAVRFVAFGQIVINL